MGGKIKNIKASEIISSGAFPTIETIVMLDDGTKGIASAPLGASTGSFEPHVLVDEDKNRYNGLGMLKAVNNVTCKIAPKLNGLDIREQAKIDQIMREIDGTPTLKNLGGNAIISVSLACARAASNFLGVELFQYLRSIYDKSNETFTMPHPMMVLIEGGKHADNSTDLQEYLIVCRTPNWKMKDQIREGIEVYHALKKILKENGYSVNVGYEGAYAPTISSNEGPLDLILKAILKAGYKPVDDIALAMDPAASEIFNEGVYELARENKKLNSSEMINYYSGLIQKFSIISMEDGLSEDDWDGWCNFMKEFGSKIMLMADDLTVTNTQRLQKAIELKAANSILIKPNQAGTLTETINTIALARKHNFKVVISHRGGGDTTDTFIADLAVAVNAEMIKCGPSRSERTDKYNRLMEIAELLGK